MTADGAERALQTRAFLGLGSSLDPEKHIRLALEALQTYPAVEIIGISTFYRTPPLPAPGAPPDSVAGDPDFLNGVVELRTTLSSTELEVLLGEIEERAGRVRSEDKYAPRTLDLDLLLLVPCEGGPSDTPAPASPHPDIRTRPWVAVPLFELAPDLLLPPDGAPLKGVVGRFQDGGGDAEPILTLSLRSKFLPGDPN